MKKLFFKYWPFLIIFLTMLCAFWPFFSQGKIPVAGDILLGQYYPWLDFKWGGRSTIFPLLNNTIADSIFSFYPWKLKAIEMIKDGSFPIYDPSTYMGSQLFATGTTGIFYPLNILFLIPDFNIGWALIVSLTVFLSGSFFYIWLRSKNLENIPVLICSIAYAFSGFIGLQVSFINTAHSVLWLPLVLFSIDRLFQKIQTKYLLLLVFCLFSSLNAGFFQGSLYIFVVAFVYSLFQFSQNKKIHNLFFIIAGFIFPVFLSAAQILPFLEATAGSSRLANYGGNAGQSEIVEFFVRFKFFITTLIPDFFGNPGKGNYSAEPGYYEFNNFVGTIAVIGLIFGLRLIKKQKEVLLCSVLLVLSLLFASNNPISILPYQFSFPVLSSLVPARLLAITQFSVLVIATYGLNSLFKKDLKLKKYLIFVTPLILLYFLIILITFAESRDLINNFNLKDLNWTTAFRNSLLPAAILLTSALLIGIYLITKKKVFFFFLIALTSFELIRQTSYFRPFISPELIYPKTPGIEFLEKNLNGNRFMITKQDLIPTNSQLVYDLKIVDGEGPIYPKQHGGFVGAIDSGNVKDELPQYRRMVYFRNNGTNLLGLLNIKYIVSSGELKNPNFKLVFEEGTIKIYENLNLYPRAWSVKNSHLIEDPVQIMKTLLQSSFNPKETAITSTPEETFSPAVINNFYQKNNLITFDTVAENKALVVISEQYYPNWRLFIDNKESKPFSADYNLIGITVPAGHHSIKLQYEMFSFKLGTYISIFSLISLIIFIIYLRLNRLKK